MNIAKRIAAGAFWDSGAGPLFRFFLEPDFLIVAYHSIDIKGERAHLEISPKVFERQLKYLQSRGYSFLHFSDFENAKGKSAFVYFDDGFKSVYKNAYPILKKLGMPFTMFLTTDYLDQKKEAGLYMTWDETRSLSDLAEFGSHSVSHKKLNKIPLSEARVEMADSKRIIEWRFGRPVLSFSYPYRRFSPELEKTALELGYKITTANKKFHKARPDYDDSFAVFKIKAGIPWF